jgi:hypothetical protein
MATTSHAKLLQSVAEVETARTGEWSPRQTMADCGEGDEKQRQSVGVILYWVWRDFVLDSRSLVRDQTLANAAVASQTLGVDGVS